jgi:hypothetical protein
MGTKVNVYVANGYTEPIWVKITDKDSGIKIPSDPITMIVASLSIKMALPLMPHLNVSGLTG